MLAQSVFSLAGVAAASKFTGKDVVLCGKVGGCLFQPNDDYNLDTAFSIGQGADTTAVALRLTNHNQLQVVDKNGNLVRIEGTTKNACVDKDWTPSTTSTQYNTTNLKIWSCLAQGASRMKNQSWDLRELSTVVQKDATVTTVQLRPTSTESCQNPVSLSQYKPCNQFCVTRAGDKTIMRLCETVNANQLWYIKEQYPCGDYSPEHATSSSCRGSIKSGETCTFECEQGYYPSGPALCTNGHYQSATCKPNECTGCKNGKGATGPACPSNGGSTCADCDANYNLWNGKCGQCKAGEHFENGKGCRVNECTGCKNGTGATGKDCPEHNGSKCVACKSDYNLLNGECIKCNAGYHFEANKGCVKNLCSDAAGSWKNVTKDAKINYDHSCIAVKFEESCEVSCAAGYTPSSTVSDQTFVCAVSGQDMVFQATGQELTCVPKTCQAPSTPFPEVSVDDCNNVTYGSSCQMKCQAGFEGTPVEVKCDRLADQTDVSFVPQINQTTAPTCTAQKCAVLPEMDSAKYIHNCQNVAYDPSGVNNHCQVECAKGYKPAAAEFQCGVDSTTGVKFIGSFPTCEEIKCEVNQRVNENQECEPCQYGYVSAGGDGAASGPTQCTEKVCDCPNGKALKGAECQKAIDNRLSQCDECDAGFRQDNAVCVRQQCQKPQEFNDPTVSVSCTGGSDKYEFETQCTLTCANGYVQGGSDIVVTCGLSSDAKSVLFPENISISDLKCAPQACAISEDMQAAHVDLSNCEQKVTGDKCAPACEPGYEPKGTVPEYDCQGVNSSTSAFVLVGEKLECVPVKCTTPVDATYNWSNCEGVAFGESCEVSCNETSEQTSSQQVTCGLQDGAVTLIYSELMACSAPHCSATTQMQSAQYSQDCDNLPYGESCSIKCAEGYTSAGSSTTASCSELVQPTEPAASRTARFPEGLQLPTCSLNQCTCNNGKGAEGIQCTTPGSEICSPDACDQGFHYSNGQCIADDVPVPKYCEVPQQFQTEAYAYDCSNAVEGAECVIKCSDDYAPAGSIDEMTLQCTVQNNEMIFQSPSEVLECTPSGMRDGDSESPLSAGAITGIVLASTGAVITVGGVLMITIGGNRNM